MGAILALSGYQECDQRNGFNNEQLVWSTKKNLRKLVLAAKSQVSGYGELIVEFQKKCQNH